MTIDISLKTALQRGANPEQILSEIERQNPDKSPSISEAKKRGATSQEILMEIVKQNQPAQDKSWFDKFRDSGIGRFLEGAGKIFGKAGEVFVNPTINAAQTGIAQPVREVIKSIPQSLKGDITGEEELKTPFGIVKDVKKQSLGKTAMQAVDIASVALPIEKLLTTPLTKAALKLYRSGMKPADIIKAGKVVTSADEIAQTGVKERIWLTQGGVEKVARKIDVLESALGDAIDEAKGMGKKIDALALKDYVDEAKNLFQNQVGVKDAEKAISEIGSLYKNFIKKYGYEIPIEKAQEIKVATGNALKKYYNLKTSMGKIEGEKQIVRGLKEKIVEQAPMVGDVNKRLSDLYKFDQALTKASRRIRNLNLLGLPSKIAGGIGGTKGFIAGKLLEIADSPAIKSGIAINLDRLATTGQDVFKGVKIPLASLITKIIEELNQEPQEPKK
jgi:hypothetical protein